VGLINGSFYALLSLGLAVIFGMLNIINFAHGALYMMGAVRSYFFERNDVLTLTSIVNVVSSSIVTWVDCFTRSWQCRPRLR